MRTVLCAAALLGGCATTSAQRDLDTIRDELSAQRKANEGQRHAIDELRIRVEQLEAHSQAKAAAPAEGAPELAALPVVRVRAPAALAPASDAPPVDTRVAIHDDAPVDLNAIIAKNSPAETAFSTAVSFYNAGDWENAATGFKRFVARFPSHSLVPQAIYMRGMTDLARERWGEAATQFQEVISGHAKSDSTPGALVGLARCELKLGHPDRARPLLQRVLSEYAGTAEATQATALLDELGATGRS